MKIRKGDTVKIIGGNDSGKTGEVLMVIPTSRKLVVKGVNVVKKHMKANQTTPHGGIVDKTLPINISNVQLLCPSCAKPARIGYRIGETGKSRICKRCKKTMK